MNLCPSARYHVLAAGPLAMDETEGVVLTAVDLTEGLGLKALDPSCMVLMAANLTEGVGLTAVGPTKCVVVTAVVPMGVVVPTGGGDWGPGRVTATSSLP